MKKGNVATEEIESYNNKKFYHIFKLKFNDVGDSNGGNSSNSYGNSNSNSNDDSNGDISGDSNGDGNAEKFDARKFHGDAERLDDIYHYYSHCHDNDDGNNIDDSDNKIDAKKFHSHYAGLIILLMIAMVVMMNLMMLIIMMRNWLV